MAAKFEEVLHIVAYNGYAEDTRQAVAVNRATWTDDRIWYPGLLPQRFGSKQKGRLQILAEHKNPYDNEEKLMDRYNTLEQMANDTHHMDIFRAQVDVRDTDGNSALTAAIENRCPNAVVFLIGHGADINQTNKKGRSALNVAKSMDQNWDKEHQTINKWNGRTVIAGVRQKRSEKIVEYLTKLGAVDIPEEMKLFRRDDLIMRLYARLEYIPILWDLDDWHDDNRVIEFKNKAIDRINGAKQPEPKRLKSSLYKQQFRR